MSRHKMVPINLGTARQLARLMDRFQELACKGCAGSFHEDDCPAREALQVRNYLTQRINNPDRHFTV